MTNQDVEDNKAQSHTSSSTNMTSLSVLDMPFPMAKNAPKKFKGHYVDIQSFIDHYEQLCTKYNVINPDLYFLTSLDKLCVILSDRHTNLS